jgi:hypothetical protein
VLAGPITRRSQVQILSSPSGSVVATNGPGLRGEGPAPTRRSLLPAATLPDNVSGLCPPRSLGSPAVATTIQGRTKRKRIRPPERVEVTCTDCGTGFTISRRTYRERTSASKAFHCSLCRTLELAPAARRCCVTNRERNWWLRRYSLPELDTLLGSIFGPAALAPAARQRRASLMASAAPRRGGRQAA